VDHGFRQEIQPDGRRGFAFQIHRQRNRSAGHRPGSRWPGVICTMKSHITVGRVNTGPSPRADTSSRYHAVCDRTGGLKRLKPVDSKGKQWGSRCPWSPGLVESVGYPQTAQPPAPGRTPPRKSGPCSRQRIASGALTFMAQTVVRQSRGTGSANGTGRGPRAPRSRVRAPVTFSDSVRGGMACRLQLQV